MSTSTIPSLSNPNPTGPEEATTDSFTLTTPEQMPTQTPSKEPSRIRIHYHKSSLTPSRNDPSPTSTSTHTSKLAPLSSTPLYQPSTRLFSPTPLNYPVHDDTWWVWTKTLDPLSIQSTEGRSIDNPRWIFRDTLKLSDLMWSCALQCIMAHESVLFFVIVIERVSTEPLSATQC